MTTQITPRVSGYKQLKKLRTVLAIARGSVVLSMLQNEAETTVSQDQAKRVTYLTELFSRIHREMYQDWKEQITVNHRPGSMMDATKRKAFREAIEHLVLDGEENNKDSAIFDNNGFVIYTDNIAQRLSRFYLSMRSVRPFCYGNRLTLDLFMTALGNLPAFKAVYEQGIDFRRLAPDDPSAMHETNGSLESLCLAFQHALDPCLTQNLQNKPNEYGQWPENKRFVSGIPFLSHKTAEGIDCLVSVTGGLVPFDHIEEKLFIAGKQLADYPLCSADNVIDHLPDTESLRVIGKTEVDGILVDATGAAPLFCLDVNMLTGLRSPSHTELLVLLKQCAGEKAQIFDLADNEPLKQKMLVIANGDERLNRAVEIAFARLSYINKKLDIAKQAIFAGKTPVAQPQLFMSMGGAGSGKTAVEELATAQCGDNFVVASLDEFRKISDLYRVLTAAEHHSDDYIYVEPFANRLRSVVAEYAKQHGFNILYDGTGIPYEPRYAKIIKKFKKAGFKTQVTAVDAFIVKPEGREDELPRSAVITSVKTRYDLTGRALPWVVTVDKHIRAPMSFLDALAHHALEKLSLFANDGERDRHYLIAESYLFSDEEVDTLQDQQRLGSLCRYLHELSLQRKDSVLNALAQGDNGQINALIQRNPLFEENNVGYLIYSSSHENRVLVIHNARRLADFIEKRQLNPNASGEKGLLHKPESLSFHVDPSCKEPWMTRLQDSC